MTSATACADYRSRIKAVQHYLRNLEDRDGLKIDAICNAAALAVLAASSLEQLSAETVRRLRAGDLPKCIQSALDENDDAALATARSRAQSFDVMLSTLRSFQLRGFDLDTQLANRSPAAADTNRNPSAQQLHLDDVRLWRKGLRGLGSLVERLDAVHKAAGNLDGHSPSRSKYLPQLLTNVAWGLSDVADDPRFIYGATSELLHKADCSSAILFRVARRVVDACRLTAVARVSSSRAVGHVVGEDGDAERREYALRALGHLNLTVAARGVHRALLGGHHAGYCRGISNLLAIVEQLGQPDGETMPEYQACNGLVMVDRILADQLPFGESVAKDAVRRIERNAASNPEWALAWSKKALSQFRPFVRRHSPDAAIALDAQADALEASEAADAGSHPETSANGATSAHPKTSGPF